MNSADLTPSYLHAVVPEDVKSLKQITLGGEPLTSKIIQTWANKVRFINAYGTSETSVTNLVNSKLHAIQIPRILGFRLVGSAGSWTPRIMTSWLQLER